MSAGGGGGRAVLLVVVCWAISYVGMFSVVRV